MWFAAFVFSCSLGLPPIVGLVLGLVLGMMPCFSGCCTLAVLFETDVYHLSKVAKLNTAQRVDANSGSHGDAALRLAIFSR
jgi:hypothetical protein